MSDRSTSWKRPDLIGRRIDQNNPPNSRVYFTFSSDIDWSVDAAVKAFSKFGPMESLFIIKGKRCGYAKFETEVAARAAVEGLQGIHITSNVTIRLRIASPHTQSSKEDKEALKQTASSNLRTEVREEKPKELKEKDDVPESTQPSEETTATVN